MKALNLMKRSFVFANKVWLSVWAAALLAGPAVSNATTSEAIYQQECAACHLAFPPGMLPAASWQQLLAGLDRHFGTNASLELQTRKQLDNWLTSQAGSYRRVRNAPSENRITRSDWFVRKHDEIGASTWKRASVGSPANCAACHANAVNGNFNEHQVRIPK